MAYIGNNTDHNAEVFKTTKDRFSGNASTTAFTLSAVPANAESMQVFVNNVRQDSGQAYTVSGTTLTFTSAPSSATGNIYVVFNSVIAGIHQVITANTQLRTGVVTQHAMSNTATYSVGELLVGGTILLDNTGVITGPSSITSTAFVGTLSTAAQPNITSLGTLTALQVDNLNINGNSIVATSGALNITPAAGSALVLDGTINVDAGVVTGATSITSTAFVGALTGNVTGNASGTAATVTTAAQPAITSVGTLTAFRSTGIDDNSNALAITIDSSENVGIGTTAPDRPLVVMAPGDATSPAVLIRGGYPGYSGSGATLLSLRDKDNTTDFFTIDTFSRLTLERFTSLGVSVPVLATDASGNVGIGTASPSTALHTVGTGLTTGIHYLGSVGASGGTAGEVYFGGVSGLVNGMRIHNKAGNALSFATAAGTKITMTDAGLVGIGTSSPTAELHVVGDLAGVNNAMLSVTRNATRNLDTGFDLSRMGSINWVDGGGTISGTLPSASHSVGDTGIYINFDPLHDVAASTNSYMLQFHNNTADHDITYRRRTGGTWGGWNRIIYANSSGNVGIGTSSPTAPLHVVGRIQQVIGTGNTALGTNALDALNASGAYNTAIGNDALGSLIQAHNNIGIGTSAMGNVSSNSVLYSIAIGSNSGQNQNGSAMYNILMGYYAGNEFSSGSNNVAIGGYAGRYFTTASNNTFLGYAAGMGHSTAKGTGSNNTALGYGAFYSATTHSTGTFVGMSAGYGVTSGSGATFVGYHAGYYQNATINNTHVGIAAGQCMNGSQNTSMGHYSMRGYTTTPANNTGTYNTAIGYSAYQNDTNSATGLTGSHNVILGAHSGDSLTSGGQNVIIGHNPAGYITTSSSNCIIGFQAALEMRAGSANNALGRNAMHNMNTGTHNQAIGYTAMYGRAIASGGVTGSHNAAIGHQGLYYLENASHNQAMGYQALHRVTSGGNNVGVGLQAGQYIRTGANNVMVGPYAGGTGYDSGTAMAHCIMIGYNPHPGVRDPNVGNSPSNPSHQIILGTNSPQGKGNSTGFIQPASGGVYQGNNGTAWTQTSDRRIKKDINPSPKGLEEILQIVPRTFYYKSNEELNEIPEFKGCQEDLPQNVLTTSAIAQELQEVFPEAVTERNDYGMLSVQTDPIIWAMLNAIKELSTKVDTLTTELEELKNGS
jgi:hypothetical protein